MSYTSLRFSDSVLPLGQVRQTLSSYWDKDRLTLSFYLPGFSDSVVLLGQVRVTLSSYWARFLWLCPFLCQVSLTLSFYVPGFSVSVFLLGPCKFDWFFPPIGPSSTYSVLLLAKFKWLCPPIEPSFSDSVLLLGEFFLTVSSNYTLILLQKKLRYK